MTITANLADGRVLNFPDGTDPAVIQARVKKMMAQEQQAEAVEERQEGTQPSHALEAFAADYGNPGYGALTVGFEDGGLTFRYNAFEGPLEHWHYDVFRVEEGDAEGTMLTFNTNSRGDVVQEAMLIAKPPGSSAIA